MNTSLPDVQTPRLHPLSDTTLYITHISLPEHGRCDVEIINGTITRIEPQMPASMLRSAPCLDGTGLTVMPGLFDLYSRCREPGLTRKGNIASESLAALQAGFSTILCTPDTQPAIDNVATVELIQHRSAGSPGATVIPMAALSIGLKGTQLSELATLQAAGCPAASQADYPLANTTVLHSAMQYASSFEMPLIITARDAQLGRDGCVHAGAVATRLGLPAIPVAAETVDLARILELCRDTGCQVHISRVSSARALQYIEQAKNEGLPVTCDVGIHHLFFTDTLISGYDASFHSTVPFRSVADRQALQSALSTGLIDAICTDHAPHEHDASLAPLPATEPGLSAYDWFIPLMLQVPEVTGLSLQQVIEKLSDQPRQIFSQPRPEPFAIGQPADFALLNTETTALLPMDNTITSAGHNNPLSVHDPAHLGLTPLRGRIEYIAHDGWLLSASSHLAQ